ncbi:HNH endonuclease signature motif containing protein [Pseudoclavibacter soli]|uniref:HNH endonuclease signature motif containing protein n=1 Tax=Pseudoclavibacter soli TaxID=452623 RepID=UPI0004164C06|nr:HNH endonuclease signature motif containing protein [Pseudoclavibacter soli]
MDFFGRLDAHLTALRGLVGDVASAEQLPAVVAGLPDDAVLQLLDASAGLASAAERLRVLAAGVVSGRSRREYGQQGLAQSTGHRDPVSLVQHLTGSTRVEALRQVRVGASLYSGVQPPQGDGEPAGAATESEPPPEPPEHQPWHAVLSAALLAGRLSAAQHDAIRRGLGDPPEQADLVDAWQTAASDLADQAPDCTVEELRRMARFCRDALDPVGAQARFDARFAQRSFRMWVDEHGQHHGRFVFDDDAANVVRTILDAALRPRTGGVRAVSDEERRRDRQLVDDPRTNQQLAHDLMIDLIGSGMHADVKTVFGVRTAGVRTVHVRRAAHDEHVAGGLKAQGVGPAQSQAQVPTPAPPGTAPAPGLAYTEDRMQVVPPSVAARQHCTSGEVNVGFDERGTPLNVGRTKRLFTPQQRIALAVRDGGCRWPSCDRPASFCEAHHIDPWNAGGRTDIDRGVLLCRFHHLQLHNNGWAITRQAQGPFILHAPDNSQQEMPAPLVSKYAFEGIQRLPRRFTRAGQADDDGPDRLSA